MIYLDTNTFYYAAGLSDGKCDIAKLRKMLAENEVRISAASFYEFVMKFRNDLESIHKGGEFLSVHNIGIVFKGFFSKPQYMPECWNIISEQEIETFIDAIWEDKVNVEAKITAVCFSMCFIMITDFVVRTDSDGKSGMFYESMFEKLISMTDEAHMLAFQKIYDAGYNSKNCEKYVRNSFNNHMNYMISTFLPVLKKTNEVETYAEYNAIANSVDWDGLSAELSKRIRRNGTTLKYIAKRARDYWKQTGDDHLETFMIKFKEGFMNRLGKGTLQEYIVDILQSFLIEGASFRKNDIIDAIIMSSISEEDSLITFDKGAINHMQKYSLDRKEYLRSLDIINKLKE